MKFRFFILTIIGFVSSLVCGISLGYAQIVPFYPSLHVWSEPGGGFFYGEQTVSLHTNYPKDQEGTAKIFYTYDIHGSLNDLYEYTDPIRITENTDLWFFSIVSPEEETDIVYEKYTILEKKAANQQQSVQPTSHDICVIEVAPREATNQDDWIELKNYGDVAYFLGGWYIETSDQTIPLPEIHIKPQQTEVMHIPLRSYKDVIRVYSRENKLMDVFQYKSIIPYLSTIGRKEFRNSKNCFRRVYQTRIPTKGVDNIF